MAYGQRWETLHVDCILLDSREREPFSIRVLLAQSSVFRIGCPLDRNHPHQDKGSSVRDGARALPREHAMSVGP